MTAHEERLSILRMVEDGRISPEEGAKLLAAIGESESKSAGVMDDSFDSSRTIRIRVSDTVTGQEKVNVRIPAGLVRLGLRFIPNSVDLDTEALLAALNSDAQGKIVDVDAKEDHKHIEIFIE